MSFEPASLFDQMDPQPMRVPVGEHRPVKRMAAGLRLEDLPTSAAAAVTIAPRTAAIYRAIIIAYHAFGPMTDEELADKVVAAAKGRWAVCTIASARSRLYKKHRLVRPTEHVRRTRRNVDAVVWELAP